MRPAILLPLILLAFLACERKPAPVSSSAPASPSSSSPSQPSIPLSTAAPSTRLNNAAPTPRVAPVPTSIPPETPATTTAPAISDIDLTNAVRQAISGDPTISPAARRIEVTVSEGVVRLSGTLASEKEKENLRVAVARVAGIKSIDNRVLVKQ